MTQIDLFKNHSYSIGPCANFMKQYKKSKFEGDSLTFRRIK